MEPIDKSNLKTPSPCGEGRGGVGLVLEGGGMRGLFTAGVLDVMMEHGVEVDGVIGVSAGALFGCNFVSGQIGRALRYNVRFKDDPRYMGLRSFIKTGNYIAPEFAYHTVPLQLDVFDNEAFVRNRTDFFLVCTDIETGKPVYKHIDEVTDSTLEWFRATGSMPVVATPVHLDGMVLLDGGMTDCIPLRYFQSQGYKRNIVILTQPEGYQKKATRLTPLFRLVYGRRYPLVADIMVRRHVMYNEQLDYVRQQEQLGDTLVIRPDHNLNIGRVEQSEAKMRSVYEHGRQKAEEMIKALPLTPPHNGRGI